MQQPSGFFDQLSQIRNAFQEGGLPAAVRQAVPAAEEYHQGGMKAVVSGSLNRLKNAGEGAAQSLAQDADFVAHHISPDPDADALHAPIHRIATGEAFGTPEPGQEEGRDLGHQLGGMLEYEMGGEALKALKPSQYLSRITKLAKFAEEHPRLARTLAAAAKGATVGGTQSAAHGGDATDIAESAALAGATEGAFTGVPEGVQHKAQQLAPETRSIAGEDIPVLASQARPEGKGPSIAETPKYAEAQQKGTAAATTNVARQAAQREIERINQTRQFPVQTDPARLLPGSAQPYAFTLETGDPAFERRGSVSQDAELQRVGTRTETQEEPTGSSAPRVEASTPAELSQGVQQGNARVQLGSTASTVPSRMMPENPIVRQVGTNALTVPDSVFAEKPSPTRTVSIEHPIYQYGEPTGEPGTEVLGGGGTLVTTEPHVARAQLSQLEDLAESKDFNNLSPRLQGRVQSQIESLRGQLADYSAYTPRFQPVDAEAASSQVHNFRDLGEQLRGSVDDVYKRIDDVSGGEFSRLRKLQRAANQQIANAPDLSPEAVNRAYKTRDDVTKQIESFLSKRPDQVNAEDWNAARHATRMASAADELHTALQASFSGPPAEVADRTGIDRTQRGGTVAINALNRVLAHRGRDIEELIGKPGVDNLYQIADLLKRPKEEHGLPKILREASMVLRRHGSGLGATAGYYLAHGVSGALGHAIPGYQGLLLGAGAGALYRRVVNEIATNPQLAQKLAYPVKQGVSTRIAAPLVASMLLQQQKENRPQNTPQNPE